MKKLLAILLCVFLTGALVSCSSPAQAPAADPGETGGAEVPADAGEPDDAPASDGGGAAKSGTEGLKIAIVVPHNNEWNQLYYQVILDKCAEYGWESQQFDAQNDATQQIDHVNSAVAQGFDVIDIQQVDNAALAPSMRRAAEAGVMVIAHYDLDPGLGLDDIVHQVLFGQKESGVLEAQTYIDLCGDTGKVALIGGLTGADNSRLRSEGMREVLDQYPGIEIVQEVFCDWDRQLAMAAAEDIITAHPDLDAFLVQDDNMSHGVYEAIKAAGKTDQIKIASQGFYESSIPAIKNDEFLFTISYPAGFFAVEAMDLAYEYYSGNDPDMIRLLGMLLVTKDNVDEAPHD